MEGFFSTKLKKIEGKLIHINKGDEIKYKEFIALLEEGAILDLFIETSHSDGSLAQLAKLHKIIRIIASHTGNNFEDIKLLIKDRSGLLIKRNVMGKEYLDWKSFGDCSREELNLAIQACIEIGDTMNLNLR